MSKTIEIGLIPSDFKGNAFISNTDCPLARAVKRHFKIKNHENIFVKPDGVKLSKRNGSYNIKYIIKNRFTADDFLFVREQYENDPQMKKVQYVVTLIEA